MFGAIDLLASEYGWPQNFILHEVYPDELALYSREISRRRLTEYMAELRITTNPHLKPEAARELFEEFNRRYRELFAIETDQLDRAGLDALKAQLRKESLSIRVK